MAAGSFQQIHPLSIPGFQESVTALAFDPVSDTLWAGSSNGFVSAVHGTRNLHGVIYPVGKKLAVRKLVTSEGCVRALNAGSMGSWGKGGVNKWHNR